MPLPLPRMQPEALAPQTPAMKHRLSDATVLVVLALLVLAGVAALFFATAAQDGPDARARPSVARAPRVDEERRAGELEHAWRETPPTEGEAAPDQEQARVAAEGGARTALTEAGRRLRGTVLLPDGTPSDERVV